jgi:hypothetical protein
MLKGRLPGYIHGAFWPTVTGLAAYAFNQAFPVIPQTLALALLGLCGSASFTVLAAHFYPDEWMFWRGKPALPAPTIEASAIRIADEPERRRLADALAKAQTKLLGEYFMREAEVLPAIETFEGGPIPELLNHLTYDEVLRVKWTHLRATSWDYCKAKVTSWDSIAKEINKNGGFIDWLKESPEAAALLAAEGKQKEAFTDLLLYLKRA